MRFDVLTLFPEAFSSFLTTSIIGRAVREGRIEVNLFDIRGFGFGRHRQVDDVPYGGGAGMVMMVEPLFAAIEHVKSLVDDGAPVVFLTPHGERFRQEIAEGFAGAGGRVILLCGHYEGVDQRVRDALVDREISLGDFVVTGGELPAQILIDAVGRLCPGVLGKEASHEEESFSAKLDRKLEYPHYTRPAVFRGLAVPDVLLSGNHGEIERWRVSSCQ